MAARFSEITKSSKNSNSKYKNPIPTITKLYRIAKNKRQGGMGISIEDCRKHLGFILDNCLHPNFNGQSIANLLWALSTLVQWNDISGFRAELLKCCSSKAPEFNAQGVANTLWALANLGVEWGQLPSDLQKKLHESCEKNVSKFNEENLRQLGQAFIWLNLPLHPSVLDSFKKRWFTLPRNNPSPLHLAIHARIKEFLPKDAGIEIINEDRIAYILDVDIHLKGMNIVIEVDGPSHNRGKRQSADDFKEKSLIKLGYQVIRVSYNRKEESLKQIEMALIRALEFQKSSLLFSVEIGTASSLGSSCSSSSFELPKLHSENISSSSDVSEKEDKNSHETRNGNLTSLSMSLSVSSLLSSVSCTSSTSNTSTSSSSSSSTGSGYPGILFMDKSRMKKLTTESPVTFHSSKRNEKRNREELVDTDKVDHHKKHKT